MLFLLPAVLLWALLLAHITCFMVNLFFTPQQQPAMRLHLPHSDGCSQAQTHCFLLIFTQRKNIACQNKKRGGEVSPPTRRGAPVLSSADLHTGIFSKGGNAP